MEVARKYDLKKRAEQQAETRRRIVEATVDLHVEHGPARTTISMIADRAGVQRHTVYAHFPDEKSLLMACSGHHLEANPFPDARQWADESDQGERLRLGLNALYAWYEANEEITAHVERDMEQHALLREISALRYGPSIGAYFEVLGQGLGGRAMAMLTLALSFHTWRTLTRDGRLERPAAVEAMAEAVLSA